jgi:tetratricopeptide (TPR) repeat protein
MKVARAEPAAQPTSAALLVKLSFLSLSAAAAQRLVARRQWRVFLMRLFDWLFGRSGAEEPHTPVAYVNRGLEFVSKRNYDRAIDDYTEAIRLQPGFAFAYTSRAYAHICKGDIDKGVSDYVEVNRLDPKILDAVTAAALSHTQDQG